MYLTPKRIAEPVARILTLDDVKAHLAVDFDDDDDLISAYILAVEQHLDGYGGILGRCLINQEWEQYFSFWTGARMILCFPDVSAASVTYFDQDNVSRTLPADQYILLNSARGAYLQFLDSFAVPSLYCRDDTITVRFTAGYGAQPENVPAEVRQAAKMIVAAWYKVRAEVSHAALSELPDSIAIRALLSKRRRLGL
ncbi:head-tail connector protein [Martelella mangrovi]|uniref:PhiE125 gp8 family phage protein n=1 Tax=Martelella mangrovi TaxID=1397477 RepID=A0ABV2IHJ2_9HYPH